MARLAVGVALTLAVGAGGCIIQGYDSGVCEDYAFAGFKGQLDFCSEHVTYRACMPVKPVRWWSAAARGLRCGCAESALCSATELLLALRPSRVRAR